MALIVYSGNELVTLDLPIQSFHHHALTLDGYRLNALACLGPYRVLSELSHLLFRGKSLTRNELVRLVQREIVTQSPYTCLLQCTDPRTDRPHALQLTRAEAGEVTIGAVIPQGSAVKYGSKPGVPFTTLTPPRLAEAPMCALTFAASRAATLPDMSRHNKLHLYTRGLVQEFALIEILERFDNSARVARTAI